MEIIEFDPEISRVFMESWGLKVPVPCTSEAAMFQRFDLWWIDQFTSRGIDMSCGAMAAILNFTIFGIVLALFAVVLAVWHFRTRDNRHPLDAMARRNTRNRKARQSAARIRFKTLRREESARQLRWAREDRELFKLNGWRIVRAN